MTAGRLASAYCFTGPAGVGKYHVAQILAQSFFCARLCGACPACKRIAAGTHPDVQRIRPEKQDIKVDQVRAMQRRLQHHPLEGPVKIVIVDQAETLHPAAANACLKILEEPPTATHFVLISAQPHRLLPTIRSRCQQIAFHPLPMALVVEQLIAQRQLSPEQAALIAAVADGSLGFALHCPLELLEETATDLATLQTEGRAHHVLAAAERWAADTESLPTRLRLLGMAMRTAIDQQLERRHPPLPPTLLAVVARLRQQPLRWLGQRLQHLIPLAQTVESTTFNKQLLCETLLFNYSRQ